MQAKICAPFKGNRYTWNGSHSVMNVLSLISINTTLEEKMLSSENVRVCSHVGANTVRGKQANIFL